MGRGEGGETLPFSTPSTPREWDLNQVLEIEAAVGPKVPGPAALASSRNLLEMPILRASGCRNPKMKQQHKKCQFLDPSQS